MLGSPYHKVLGSEAERVSVFCPLLIFFTTSISAVGKNAPRFVHRGIPEILGQRLVGGGEGGWWKFGRWDLRFQRLTFVY